MLSAPARVTILAAEEKGMTEPIRFFVAGNPAPGGSKTAFVARRKGGEIVMRPGTNVPIINMSDAGGGRTKVWRKAVAWEGRRVMMTEKIIEGACKVEFIFFLKRPQNHFRSGKFAGIPKENAPLHHTQKPDCLKFSRSTEDALTGIVWRDDAQTIRICSEKRWCGPEDTPGCAITVIPL